MTDETPYRSAPFRIAHANIKGTPRMPVEHVRDDLEVLAEKAGILGLVEFRWGYYWKTLGRILGSFLTAEKRAKKDLTRWRFYPGLARGIRNAVFGGQMFAWKAARWKKRGARTALLHKGAAGISEDRRIRRVTLEDRPTRLCLTCLVTHNVVAGDNDHDSPRRRAILREDIDVIVREVRAAIQLGHPVVLMLDANINSESDVYDEFMRRVVRELGGKVVGTHGVEYLIVYPGRNGTRLVVDDEWKIYPRAHGGLLWTDHEVRGITGHLVADRP